MRISDWSSDVCSSDLLPVRQFVRTLKGWRERVVTLDEDGRFVPTSGRRPADPLIPPRLVHSHEGAIVEASPASAAIMEALAQSIVRQGGAMLIVDYGYEGPAVGDTLQAVKGHSYADGFRSEERRVGKEGVRTFNFGW